MTFSGRTVQLKVAGRRAIQAVGCGVVLEVGHVWRVRTGVPWGLRTRLFPGKNRQTQMHQAVSSKVCIKQSRHTTQIQNKTSGSSQVPESFSSLRQASQAINPVDPATKRKVPSRAIDLVSCGFGTAASEIWGIPSFFFGKTTVKIIVHIRNRDTLP